MNAIIVYIAGPALPRIVMLANGPRVLYMVKISPVR